MENIAGTPTRCDRQHKNDVFWHRAPLTDAVRTGTPVADAEATTKRANDAQVLEDAERLITAWNERQAKRMPLLFAPTISAALAARYWFLWVHCPACRTMQAIDLRQIDRHRDAAVTSLIPSLSCRACRTRRLQNSCACQKPVSPMKCGSSTRQVSRGGVQLLYRICEQRLWSEIITALPDMYA